MNNQKVVVIGHKNPDTDSICSAISYAALKSQTSELSYEPRRAGKLNQETEYVLERFGFPVPRLCTDVFPKIRNVEYRHIDGISPSTSMREAWSIMKEKSIDSLAVVDEEKNLAGLITMQMIAEANMDVFDNQVLAKSKTTYKNILSTLSGTMIVGDPDGMVHEDSHVLIGTSSPDVLEQILQEGDIVILSNRYESQLCAIEMGVSLLIVCQGVNIGKTIKKLAEENGTAIMSVPYDTYAAGKLISQCAPISYCMMEPDNVTKFTLFTAVEDAINVMSKVRFRYFPILDENGKYCGMLSRRNILKMEKRKIILVDHNEKTQAVDGFDQSEILEIIDHHRIGTLETAGPVYFRNQPLGSTASIITLMYDENGVEISAPIAGLLLSAILSDTLKFSSPTCTKLDRVLAERLAKICGLDIDRYAEEMFAVAERLDGKSAEELLTQDFKIFMCGDYRFAAAQMTFLTLENLKRAQEIAKPFLAEFRLSQNVEDLYFMLTDIQKSESTVLCCGSKAAKILPEAFGGKLSDEGTMLLQGVVSRKKQLIPKLMEAYQNL